MASQTRRNPKAVLCFLSISSLLWKYLIDYSARLTFLHLWNESQLKVTLERGLSNFNRLLPTGKITEKTVNSTNWSVAIRLSKKGRWLLTYSSAPFSFFSLNPAWVELVTNWSVDRCTLSHGATPRLRRSKSHHCFVGTLLSAAEIQIINLSLVLCR
jgi:hypothetical protein